MTLYKALTTEWFNENVQSGSISIVNATSASVTFVTSFTLVPKVILTMRDPTNKVPVITLLTVSGFTVSMGNVTTVDIDWLAVAR